MIPLVGPDAPEPAQHEHCGCGLERMLAAGATIVRRFGRGLQGGKRPRRGMQAPSGPATQTSPEGPIDREP
jgi:hypothetical protein